jgi:Zn-dependent M28 family amino/carboxypeptidase
MRNSRLIGLLMFLLISSAFLFVSCRGDKPGGNPQTVTRERPPAKVPAFNADRAYDDIAKQLSFGPRVLGSEGHAACQAWLIEQFKATGAKVIEQTFIANVYTGEKFPAANIIAQFNPEISDRIVLAAHWDTRHVADSPLSTEREDEPILGADDAGSGVAVLLEIARQLQAQPVGIGVDIVLFDAEDYGESGGGAGSANTYALGSQHWSRNPHGPYKPRYGILLDMVGAKGAQFPIEGFSYEYARNVVEKVWKLAIQMGKGNYFLNKGGGRITDDHYFVNTIANIPMIDIINMPSNGQSMSFGAHWHTHNDNMDIIDKNTLRAVGQVVTAVVYKEDAGEL